MDAVLIVAVTVVLAAVVWYAYKNFTDKVSEDVTKTDDAPPVVPSAVVKPIYEQPTRSEASDIYQQSSPVAVNAGPATSTTVKVEAPKVEDKPKRRRAKKEEAAPKVEEKPKGRRGKKEPKLDVAQAWPFPEPKSGRRRGKTATQ